MRRLFILLMLTVSLMAGVLAAGSLAACNRDRPPRTAPYMPEPASSSSGGIDGGDMTSPDGGPSTAPTIQPQPGDIQL